MEVSLCVSVDWLYIAPCAKIVWVDLTPGKDPWLSPMEGVLLKFFALVE